MSNVLLLIITMSFVLCGANCEGEFPQGVTPPTGGTQTSQNITITIQPGVTGLGANAFGENPLAISTGTMVTWVNGDATPHSIVSTTNAWDSGALNPGQGFSFTFNGAGTFEYFCGVHGAVSESGTITVTAAAGTGAFPSPSPFGFPAPFPSPTPSPIAFPR